MSFMMVFVLICIFVLGTIVGSLLNVCIYRMQLEKSIVWPGSRCGTCLQAIRWYWNIPVVSYLLLRGRCRICGQKFSARYCLIELATGLAFVLLFYLEVIENVHHFKGVRDAKQLLAFNLLPVWQGWVVFVVHAVLVSFLIVATFCDLDKREIPLSLTVTGTIIGLLIAIFFAWPWPNPPAALQPIAPGPWWRLPLNPGLPSGLYPWPVWGPLPSWLPAGSWQLGLATGLVGLVVGTVMLRVVRVVFSMGLGMEALGLGDADLMMMAGAFLGWQPLVVAFFISVGPGLLFALLHMIGRRIRTRPDKAIHAEATLKDGKPAVSLDGEVVPVDQLESTLAAKMQATGKSVLWLDTGGFDDFRDTVVLAVQGAAREARIRKVRIPTQETPPGIFGRLFVLLSGWLRRRERFTIPADVSMQEGHALFRINGEPVAEEQLAAALREAAKGQHRPQVVADTSGLEKWLERTLTDIRLTARQAGARRIHMQDNAIPFGPALALGLVLTMLCWDMPFAMLPNGNAIAFAAQFQMFFFNEWFILAAAGVFCVFMLGSSYFIRLMRMMRH